MLLLGRGLFILSYTAHTRAALGRWGVDLSIPVEQGGVVDYGSRVFGSTSMTSVVLMSRGLAEPHLTINSVGAFPFTSPKRLVFSAYT